VMVLLVVELDESLDPDPCRQEGGKALHRIVIWLPVNQPRLQSDVEGLWSGSIDGGGWLIW
jgi:hypothetical protein